MIRNRKLYLTYVIIAINVLMFILMVFIDKSFDFSVQTLIKFGAKYNPLIATGEYYRLITSMFLHSDITHILFNMYALNILGKNIELVYGKFKFIVIYMLAGILGSLGSFIFSSSVSVGASGAIFGLLGSYLYLFLSKSHIFNRNYLKNLLSIIGINLLFGILVPNIDNLAHVAGLIGGFIISWSLGVRGEKLSFKKVFMQTLVILLICTSLFFGVKRNQNSWEYNLYQGEKYLKENKITEAELQFETGLSKNDNIEIFHYYLGHISLLKDDTPKAKYHFGKAIEIDPEFTEAKEILEKLY